MSSSAESSLFQSFGLADLPLANRVAMAPMTRARAGASRTPNALMAEYYAQRAGAGLIITEATTVSAQANGWVNSPGIYEDAHEEGWKPVVNAIHAAGSTVFLQLWHCGRASHSSFHGGELPVAPSAVKLEGDGVHTANGKEPHETPRALETAEIAPIIQDYVQAAERAKRAGFDGIEVHGANGYLLDEFLQSKTNQRTDQYGGSVENRFRLLREIVEAVTKVFPAGRVAVRLSPNGVFNDMGSPDYRETFLYAAKELSAFGLAYLHVMDGLGFGFHELGEPMTLAQIREVYPGMLMGNCAYDVDAANAVIASGAADMIAFGRPFIANPDLVERMKNGWTLAESDPVTWYSGVHAELGYTDFPSYSTTV